MGQSLIGALSMGSTVLGGGMEAGGQLSGAIGGLQSSGAQSDILKQNAYLSELSAKDALAAGKVAEQQKYIEGAQTIGAQRAAFAAKGVVVDKNSADVLASDVKRFTTQDAQTIKANAERQAYAYRLQGYTYKAAAQQARTQGIQGLIGGVVGAGGSLLTTAGKVAAKWMYYNNESDTTTAGLS